MELRRQEWRQQQLSNRRRAGMIRLRDNQIMALLMVLKNKNVPLDVKRIIVGYFKLNNPIPQRI